MTASNRDRSASSEDVPPSLGVGFAFSRGMTHGVLRSAARRTSQGSGHGALRSSAHRAPSGIQSGALRGAGGRSSVESDPVFSGSRVTVPFGVRTAGDSRVREHAGVCAATSVEAWSVRTPAQAGGQTGQDSNGRRAKAAVMRYGC
jgi:hypothetical protein